MEWIQALKEAVSGGTRPEKTLPEGRGSYRLPAHLPATVQLQGGQLVIGTVVNFSTRGLKLLMPVVAPRKSMLMLTVRGRHRPGQQDNTSPIMRVEARVVWVQRQKTGDQYEMGLEAVRLYDTQYNDLVDFFRDELRLPPQDMAQRRKSRRVRCRFPVTWVDETRKTVPGTSVDLSPWGIRFRTQQPNNARNVKLSLEVPDGQPPIQASGQVRRWSPVPRSRHFEVVATLVSLNRVDKERLLAVMERSEHQEDLSQVDTPSATEASN